MTNTRIEGTTMSTNRTTFDALLSAIEAGDVKAATGACADDVVIWHNTTMVDESADSLTATLEWLHANFTNVHYERGTVREGGNSIVREVVLVATAPDGDEMRTPTCINADFRDGLISSMRVYLSTSHSLQNKVSR